ncbi:MAG: glycosyltransferase [Gammaproteobacteria bacterium]
MQSPSEIPANGAAPLACTIIIPTRDKLEFLRPCIESILQTSGEHRYEILVVDNQSKETETLQYLSEIQTKDNISVLNWDSSFNFSAINNFAARQSQAQVLCFLNNDVEISDPEWLHRMLPLVQREDVGACGCTLLYPDRTIQHAGIALDEKSIARHIAINEPQDFLQQNGFNNPFAVAAVTAACLFVRRDLFLLHQGFNEDTLAVAFNDVDLCLRIREKGQPVLLHPGVQLIHHESVSRMSDQLAANRSRALREFDYMQQRWGRSLAGQRYKSGIPDYVAEQLADQNDLEAAIRNAIASLYEEAASQGSGTQLQSDEPDTIASQRTMSFKELEERYEALQKHVRNVEDAYQLIQTSLSWRVTTPLRYVKNLLGSSRNSDDDDGNVPEKKQSKENESTLKAEYDRDAQRKLDTFLTSNERLVFPKSDNPRLSIVLVFYNRAPLSYLCLRSILEQVDEAYELIIVDNQSTDETPGLLDRLDGVVIERNAENLGFVKAVNQAAKLVKGKYLLLLNNDALLEEGAVQAAIETMQQSDDVGAVGAKIKLLDGTLQEAGSIIWNDGACSGYGRGRNPTAAEFMMQRDVDYCSGAFLMVESQLFQELGCFDEEYAPAYYEESDFCIRLRQLGYRIVYDPRIQITHYEFASSGGISGAGKLQQAHREILCKNHPVFLSRQYDNNPENMLLARTANNYPNVLIIDDRVPYPSLGAGYPRCSHILNSLARLPVNLSFYPLLYPDDNWDDVYSLLEPNIEVMLGRGMEGLLDFLQERKGFYQTIMVSRVHNMEYFNRTLNPHEELLDGVEIIYDAEAVSAPREVLQRKLWGESISDAQARQMVADELAQARDADKVVAVSEQEASIYHEHQIRNTIVLGHRLPMEPTPKSFAERSGLLFVGALRDEGSPNVDSLLWFLMNCLPALEQKIPELKLYIVGDNTVPSLSTVAKNNVVFTGRLDSIEEYYNDCRVFIAPTRFAAGIPHKVHEAASKGLPCVTTSLLARQLQWSNGEELLSADEPEDFVKQCAQLYSDEKLWQKIRETGLEAVERDCSEQSFQQNLRQLFGIEALDF